MGENTEEIVEMLNSFIETNNISMNHKQIICDALSHEVQPVYHLPLPEFKILSVSLFLSITSE